MVDRLLGTANWKNRRGATLNFTYPRSLIPTYLPTRFGVSIRTFPVGFRPEVALGEPNSRDPILADTSSDRTECAHATRRATPRRHRAGGPNGAAHRQSSPSNVLVRVGPVAVVLSSSAGRCRAPRDGFSAVVSAWRTTVLGVRRPRSSREDVFRMRLRRRQRTYLDGTCLDTPGGKRLGCGGTGLSFSRSPFSPPISRPPPDKRS